MNKIVYGIHYPSFENGKFLPGSIYPLEVLSDNGLVFVAKDETGRKFQSALKNYYNDEKSAWEKMYTDIYETIIGLRNQIEELTISANMFEQYLHDEKNFR
jgi:hypothetical protein